MSEDATGEPMWSAYDQMGSDFEEHSADSAYNAHYDRPAVLAAVGSVGGLRVLDAACGPGYYAGELLARGAVVTAFDASPTMVALARQRTTGRARIDTAVLGEPLPYPDGAFDLAVCALAIHYAADRAAAFAEFFRVLRPGGALVISTQHPVTDWLRKGGSYFDVKLEADIWRTRSGEKEIRFWRELLSRLCAAATGAGFLIQEVVEPLPAETMRERYPADYDKLTREPGFLLLRLIKAGWVTYRRAPLAVPARLPVLSVISVNGRNREVAWAEETVQIAEETVQIKEYGGARQITPVRARPGGPAGPHLRL